MSYGSWMEDKTLSLSLKDSKKSGEWLVTEQVTMRVGRVMNGSAKLSHPWRGPVEGAASLLGGGQGRGAGPGRWMGASGIEEAEDEWGLQVLKRQNTFFTFPSEQIIN